MSKMRKFYGCLWCRNEIAIVKVIKVKGGKKWGVFT